MNNVDQVVLIEKYIAAYNRFDVECMLSCIHDDVRFENYSSDSLTTSAAGKTEFYSLAMSSLELFATREQQVSMVVARGDALVVTVDFRATLKKDLPNGTKAGAAISLRGVSEFSFEDGKISRIVDRA